MANGTPPGATAPPQQRSSATLRTLRRVVRDAVRQNLSLKVIAAAMAVVAWLLVHGRPTAEDYATIRLEYAWPDHLVLQNQPVDQVLIKARGPRSSLRELSRRELRYPVDLSAMEPGETTLNLTGMRVEELPAGLDVTTISPSSLTFRFDERGEKALPVKVVTRGEVAFGFEVESIVVEPDLVKLSGAASELEPLEEIRTQVVDLSGRDREFAEIVGLDLGTMRVRPEHDAELSVFVKLKQIVEEREIEVPIALPEGVEGLEVSPAVARVTLRGPARELHRVRASTVLLALVPDQLTYRGAVADAVYDPTGEETRGIELRTASLPGNIELIGVEPTRFTVTKTNP